MNLINKLMVCLVAVSLLTVTGCTRLSANPHQPSNFRQMQALVTPGEPVLEKVLAKALEYSTVLSGIDPGKEQRDFNYIRYWVSSYITYTSDEKAHGMPDYWQTPAETIELGTGDCEDFAILFVSLLRAYGVPEDQAYIAVGDDTSGLWHAYVIERYYQGVWRILNPEYARDATFLDSVDGKTYRVSYCFNDKTGFKGLPKYPAGYNVPEIPPNTPSGDTHFQRILGAPGIIDLPKSIPDDTLDEAKAIFGKLWVPGYVPEGYSLAWIFVYTTPEIVFRYQKGGISSDFYVMEYPGGTEISYPEGSAVEVLVNGSTAYLARGSWLQPGGPGSPLVWNSNMALFLTFALDGWAITIRGSWADSWTNEELIKIAESMVLY